jgi:hypothetical protein
MIDGAQNYVEPRGNLDGLYKFEGDESTAEPVDFVIQNGEVDVIEGGSSIMKRFNMAGYISYSYLAKVSNPYGVYNDGNYVYVSDEPDAGPNKQDFVYLYDNNLEYLHLRLTLGMKGPFDSYHTQTDQYATETWDSDPISITGNGDTFYVLTQDWETILKFKRDEATATPKITETLERGKPREIMGVSMNYTHDHAGVYYVSVNSLMYALYHDEEPQDIGVGQMTLVSAAQDKSSIVIDVTKNAAQIKPQNWDNKNTNRIYVGEEKGGNDIDYLDAPDQPQTCTAEGCTMRQKSMIYHDGKLYVSLGINKIKVYDASTGKYIEEFGKEQLATPFNPEITGRMASDGNLIYYADTVSKSIKKFSFDDKYLGEIKIIGEEGTPYNLAVGKIFDPSIKTNKDAIAVGVLRESKKGLLIINSNGEVLEDLFPRERKIIVELDNSKGFIKREVIRRDVIIPIGLGENELHPGDMLVKGNADHFGHTQAFYADVNANGIFDDEDAIYEWGINYDRIDSESFVIRKWKNAV